MRELPYDRTAAIAYARRWALSRNPAYYNFEHIGGDCTNFASQCILAGSHAMNYTPIVGWYYRTLSDRTASWTGVEYLRNFLVLNKSVGPYAQEVPREAAEPGDIVQLGRKNGKFYHSPVIISVSPLLLVAAHSLDTVNKPLDEYAYNTVRFLHIIGVRVAR